MGGDPGDVDAAGAVLDDDEPALRRATKRLDLYQKGGKAPPGLGQGITEGGAKGRPVAQPLGEGGDPDGGQGPVEHRQQSTNLADMRERVLDKGIVVAGDIRVNLLEIELLTIKVRLLIASVDKARDWH